MTTRNETTVTIAHSVDKVLQAWKTQSYWEYIIANLSTEPGEVHEFTTTEEGAVATLFEVMPLDMLPEAVRGMISQALKIKRVFTLNNASSAEYTADIKGAPVDFKGEIAISADADSTTLVYSNELNVAIPMLGAVIEPKVAAGLADLFQKEADLAAQWISDNL